EILGECPQGAQKGVLIAHGPHKLGLTPPVCLVLVRSKDKTNSMGMTLFLWKEEARKVREVSVMPLLSTKDEEVSQEDIEAGLKCLTMLTGGCLKKAAIELLELLGQVSR